MSDDPDEILGPAELGRKLVIALRSVSDPQALMQSIADRSNTTLRNELTPRIDSIVEAIKVAHENFVRVPTDVQKSVTALQALLEQYIRASLATLQAEIGRELERIHGSTDKLSEVSDERFRSIAVQFTLLKQATEQLDIANKTAIAAALQAQKEQAEETKRTSQTAIAKSEASTGEAIKALTSSTGEAIKALTTNFNTAITGIEVRINDLKGRLDRGEGKSGVSDPEIAASLREVTMLRLAHAGGEGRSQQSDAGLKTTLTVGGMLIALIAVLLTVFEIMKSSGAGGN